MKSKKGLRILNVLVAILLALGNALIGITPVSAADSVTAAATPSSITPPDGGQVTVAVNVGGVDIAPVYAGRSPSLPGADQINLVLPDNVATGCTVPVYVKFGSQTSNTATTIRSNRSRSSSK